MNNTCKTLFQVNKTIKGASNIVLSLKMTFPWVICNAISKSFKHFIINYSIDRVSNTNANLTNADRQEIDSALTALLKTTTSTHSSNWSKEEYPKHTTTKA